MYEDELREFYASRALFDIDKHLSFAADGCIYRMIGSEAATGAPQDTDIRAAAEKMFAIWDLSKINSVSKEWIEDTVYVHREGTVVYRPDGSELQTEFMDKLTFKDGKITEYLQFVDTLAIAELLKNKPPPGAA